MNSYKIEITFSTDQELTNGELADLESAISLQLEEPRDYDQNDVSYQVNAINYTMTKESN
jgi:predicted component of type VI protein secretion system